MGVDGKNVTNLGSGNDILSDRTVVAEMFTQNSYDFKDYL